MLSRALAEAVNGTTRMDVVRGRVYDLAGRLVRDMGAHQVASAGRHVVVRNGKDDGGRDVSSGVYLVRLNGLNRDDKGKIALMR